MMVKPKRGPKPVWVPRILSEYEIGLCTEAIRAVSLLGKPFSKVSMRSGGLADLKADLAGCLKSNNSSGVRYWIRRYKFRGYLWYRYGFYKEPWTLEALDFCDRSKLSDFDRSWIQGLLFGYKDNQIQKFIDKKVNKTPSRRTKRATKR